MNGKKIGGWIVRDGIAAVDGTSLPWGLTPLYSIVFHGICLVCGHKGRCVRCDGQITGEDMPAYVNGRLCNYCYHMSSKED